MDDATVRNTIRGVSERRRLPRLGKIRIGIKVANSRPCDRHRAVDMSCSRCTHPQATDYFVVPPELQKVLGEKPTEIQILFPSDDPDALLRQNFRFYGRSTGLLCVGDGWNARALVKPKFFRTWLGQSEGEIGYPPRELWATYQGQQGEEPPEWQHIRCYGGGYDGEPACPMFGNGCGPNGNLSFVIPDAPGLGIWQIETGSPQSIEDLNSSLDFIRTATGGRLAGIPLVLRLRAREVAPDGRKKTVHTIDIGFAGTFREVMALGAQREKVSALLPEPEHDGDEDVVEVIDPPIAVTQPETPAAAPEAPAATPNVEDRPFEADDVARAEQLLAWARDQHRMSADLVFKVLGVRDVAGIVLMGVPEAQSKIEEAAEQSIPIEAEAGVVEADIPPLRGRGDLFSWGLKQPQKFSPADFIRFSEAQGETHQERVIDLDRVASEKGGFEAIARLALAGRPVIA